jgi:uncharacterized membrane protein YkvA (DUF1232 family)
MTPTTWLLLCVGVLAVLYLGAVAGLIVLGRREDARALAGFIPDCIVLMRRLLRDERVPRRRKLLLVVLVGYLAMPFDLIPDFIPVAGQLDDVIIVAWVLRRILRGGNRELLAEHWPGPERSLAVVSRIAFGATTTRSAT